MQLSNVLRTSTGLCVVFQGCRSVEEFQCLNRIEEGTYGVVYRAKDKKTGMKINMLVHLLLGFSDVFIGETMNTVSCLQMKLLP